MNKVEASNLLRTSLGASVAELEADYRKRREEVRRRFETAPDRNTRSRCEREYFALEQAHDLLLAETDDLLGGDETPAVEHEEPEAKLKTPLVEREEQPGDREGLALELKAPSLEPVIEREELEVKRQAPLVEREGQPVDRQTLTAELKAPAVECERSAVERQEFLVQREEPSAARAKLPLDPQTSPAQRAETVVGRRDLPTKRVASPLPPVGSRIKRVCGAIEPALSPLQRVAGPITGIPSPTKGIAERSGNSLTPIEDVSPPKAAELKPIKPVLEPGRRGSASKVRAMTGVVFIFVLASVLVFFLFRAANKPKQGVLVVNTVPDGAEVWVDAVPRGKTPLILEDVTPGDRRLTIKLPAYMDEEIVVSIKPGEEKSTRILQLVPMEQSSPRSVGRSSSSSRPDLVIVPPTASPTVAHPRDPGQ
jgi:PEGA domain